MQQDPLVYANKASKHQNFFFSGLNYCFTAQPARQHSWIMNVRSVLNPETEQIPPQALKTVQALLQQLPAGLVHHGREGRMETWSLLHPHVGMLSTQLHIPLCSSTAEASEVMLRGQQPRQCQQQSFLEVNSRRQGG